MKGAAYSCLVSPRNHPGEMSWDGGPYLNELGRDQGPPCLDMVLQVGTGRLCGDSGVLVDLLELVGVIEPEGETQVRPCFVPWVPPLHPIVALTHSQGHYTIWMDVLCPPPPWPRPGLNNTLGPTPRPSPEAPWPGGTVRSIWPCSPWGSESAERALGSKSPPGTATPLLLAHPARQQTGTHLFFRD